MSRDPHLTNTNQSLHFLRAREQHPQSRHRALPKYSKNPIKILFDYCMACIDCKFHSGNPHSSEGCEAHIQCRIVWNWFHAKRLPGVHPNLKNGTKEHPKASPNASRKAPQDHQNEPAGFKNPPLQPVDWAGWRVVPWRRKYCSVGVYLSRCVGARDGQGWQMRRRW